MYWNVVQSRDSKVINMERTLPFPRECSDTASSGQDAQVRMSASQIGKPERTRSCAKLSYEYES